MRDLAGGPRRFVELQRTLPGISTEQLRSRLNRMVADGLLTRQRYREVPPRVDYELTPRSRALLPVVSELARWGYRFAWGPPRPGERVDVGAVLRAATGLELARSLRGTIEFDRRPTPRRASCATRCASRTGSCATPSTRPPSRTRACRGPERAWVEAFGPDGPRPELEFEGDQPLARAVLDGIADRAASNGAAPRRLKTGTPQPSPRRARATPPASSPSSRSVLVAGAMPADERDARGRERRAPWRRRGRARRWHAPSARRRGDAHGEAAVVQQRDPRRRGARCQAHADRASHRDRLRMLGEGLEPPRPIAGRPGLSRLRLPVPPPEPWTPVPVPSTRTLACPQDRVPHAAEHRNVRALRVFF